MSSFNEKAEALRKQQEQAQLQAVAEFNVFAAKKLSGRHWHLNRFAALHY